MSQIKKLVQEIEYGKHVNDLQDKTKTSVTVRLEPQHIFKIDYLAEKYETTRSGMATELLISAAMDVMTELGFDDKEQFDMWAKTLNFKSEVK